MAEETTCAPETAPCNCRGLPWYDWAYSTFKKLCELCGWAAFISSKLHTNPNGAVNINPSFHRINAPGSVLTVTVPAGALSVQAIIEDGYGAQSQLTVMQGSTPILLPPGVDLNLPAISPIFTADSDGNNGSRAHGVYSAVVIKFPAGSKGVVCATYKGTPLPITAV